MTTPKISDELKIGSKRYQVVGLATCPAIIPATPSRVARMTTTAQLYRPAYSGMKRSAPVATGDAMLCTEPDPISPSMARDMGLAAFQKTYIVRLKDGENVVTLAITDKDAVNG